MPALHIRLYWLFCRPVGNWLARHQGKESDTIYQAVYSAILALQCCNWTKHQLWKLQHEPFRNEMRNGRQYARFRFTKTWRLPRPPRTAVGYSNSDIFTLQKFAIKGCTRMYRPWWLPPKVHLCIKHHRFCYVGNKISWNGDSIHFLQMALNVSTAHPVWVHSLKLNDWTKCKLWKLFNSCAKRAYANERVCELANSIFITATDGGSDNSSDILAWAKIRYQTMYKDVHCLMSAPF